MLLDEADVFLQKRDGNDIIRNADVSVFLRQLEYFTGVMFLTSNLASNIDPAFSSRIIQTFEYKEMDESGRAQIWQTLCAYQKLEISDRQASVLAKYQVNGREIKNILRASIANALYQGCDLSYEIVKDTAEFMIAHRPK